MVDTGIYATTLQVQNKAGANASAVANTEIYINDFVRQAESLINVRTRKNWSDGFEDLNDDIKYVLSEVASDIAATYVINYDMSGFTSRAEAETMLDVLNNAINRGLQILKEQEQQTFMEKQTE